MQGVPCSKKNFCASISHSLINQFLNLCHSFSSLIIHSSERLQWLSLSTLKILFPLSPLFSHYTVTVFYFSAFYFCVTQTIPWNATVAFNDATNTNLCFDATRGVYTCCSETTISERGGLVQFNWVVQSPRLRSFTLITANPRGQRKPWNPRTIASFSKCDGKSSLQAHASRQEPMYMSRSRQPSARSWRCRECPPSIVGVQ